MPRCPVPETKPVVAGATMSVRTTSTDPRGWPRTRIVSFPPRRTAARSMPNAARPSESVERVSVATPMSGPSGRNERSEEHTSELQSQSNLVCRLLLEKKKKKKNQLQITSLLTVHLQQI